MQPDGRFDRRWVLRALTLAVACGEPAVSIPPPAEYEQGPSPSTKADPVATCDEAPNGTPCGEPGKGTHCLFDACVKNACGDGVKAGGEACDDGDELDGNGCSARCRLEECGNGVIDVGEECDDGNADALDHCNACRKQMPVDAGAVGMNDSRPSAGCPSAATLSATPATASRDASITFSGPTLAGVGYAWSVIPQGAVGIDTPGPIIDSLFTPAAATVTCGALLISDSVTSTFNPAGSLPLVGTVTAKRLVTKQGCSPFVEEITAVCVDGDAGTEPLDGGSDTDSGMDAGTPMDVGSPEASTPEAGREAGPPLDYDACVACLQTGCADHNTIPLSGVCFNSATEGLNGDAIPQPNTTQRCTDAVQCSITATTGCAKDVVGPARCYCGEQTLAECQSRGPRPDAPCIGPWERVTECDSVAGAAAKNTCVLGEFQALARPAGYAFFMIECANATCQQACGLVP